MTDKHPSDQSKYLNTFKNGSVGQKKLENLFYNLEAETKFDIKF